MDADYIYHLNNQTKILINVRNPVERQWSEYLALTKSPNKSAEHFHEYVERELAIYRRCLAKRTLRSCIYDRPMSLFASMDENELVENEGRCRIPCKRRNDEGKPIDCPTSQPKFKVMLRRGVYHVFIKDYLRVFPRKQVLIQRLESIRDKPRESLIKTYQFLGLRMLNDSAVDKILYHKVANSRKAPVQHLEMLPATRYMLYDFYKPHNEALASLLNDTSFNYRPSS